MDRFGWMFKQLQGKRKQTGSSRCRASLENQRMLLSFVLGMVISGYLFLLPGCSGFEQSEREKLRRRNCKTEGIYRNKEEHFASVSSPIHTPRSVYPWEAEANLPRITKEYFRCKGSSSNPVVLQSGGESLRDCEGNRQHGLPIIGGREGVYPVMIELLNYVQRKTGKRVIVTCGHRCPIHNVYADPAKENRTSKHQIGAEVDFYVQGMEDRPLEIAGLLMQYYREVGAYKTDKEYLEFKRCERVLGSIQPWMNKEIFIKVHEKGESRDGDNRHPYPYVTLQVRYDRERKQKVVYEWSKANQGYARGP